MKHPFMVSVWIIGLSMVPSVVFGAGIRVASDITTVETDTFSDNQYLVGGRVDAHSTMQQDISIVGGRSALSGTVAQDALVIGGESVHVSGNIQGDARVLGSDVLIDGTVTGDLVIIGGTVRVAKEAVISGETLIVGGTVVFDAAPTKHIRIIGGAVTIGGTIAQTANITTQRLQFTNTANIPGSIVYFAPQEFTKDDGAIITGTVKFNKINSIRENGIVEHAVVSFLNFWIVLRFVTTLMLTFLIVFIFKVFTQKTTEHMLQKFGSSVAIGAATIIFLPVAGIIFLASLILFPVALLLGLAYIFIMIIASSLAGVAVGALIKRVFTKTDTIEVSFHTAVIGVVLLTLIQFVPVVGELTRFVFFLAAVGAIWRYVYESVRWRKILLFEKK